ncbi:hypothetical protein NQ318_009328 [Aromia moschata]|uniref:Uncharacterized protein n=1 Tax=Aromia moschata TaxID=1265417 RepID=A0AAV8XPM8_9CUCU|nr:hypothetical protein NQ318_009328 [Aromia moschata]
MSLVIPTYVPLDRLAAASGIQMMVNGICIIIGGPLLGVVRDITGSYSLCIILMNCVTFTTVIMWTTEYVLRRYRNKEENKPKEIAQEQDT